MPSRCTRCSKKVSRLPRKVSTQVSSAGTSYFSRSLAMCTAEAPNSEPISTRRVGRRVRINCSNTGWSLYQPLRPPGLGLAGKRVYGSHSPQTNCRRLLKVVTVMAGSDVEGGRLAGFAALFVGLGRLREADAGVCQRAVQHDAQDRARIACVSELAAGPV